MIKIISFGLTDFFIFLLFILLSVLWKRSRRPTEYPPGPTPLPLIGNIYNITDTHVLKTFRELRRKYGDIFSLSIGKFWVIVVNGRENLREICIKNGENTSDRPPFYMKKLLGSEGILHTNGYMWKHTRTFTISKLRDFGFGKRSFEDSIMEEVHDFLQLLRSYEGNPFDWAGILNTSMLNIVMSITMGRRFEYDDPELTQIVKTISDFASNPAIHGPVNFIPELANIPGDPFKVKCLNGKYKILFDYFRREVEARVSKYDESHINDFIDAYVKQMKAVGKSKFYSVDKLVNIIADLTGAGAETSATTLKWTFLYLIRQPDIQDKMKNELDNVVGAGRIPRLSDRPNLPYCNAVITESLRLGNNTPLSIPHQASGDFVCKGFKIPKGSVIFPCLDSVAHDEKVFPNSHIFDPERFLDESGKLCSQETVMAFSLGNRMCPGESFAKMELFLYITTLIQMFEFRPTEGESLPTTESVFGLTNSPQPYKLRAIPRN